MKSPIASRWGKFDRVTGDWHPLVDHCADVAATAETLVTATLLGERLARLLGRDRFDEVALARLMVLVALHDLGKTNQGFWTKAFDPGCRVGHVLEWLALVRGKPSEVGSLLGVIPDWEAGDDHDGLGNLLASICHHGRPRAFSEVENSMYSENHWPKESWDAMRELIEATRLWFPLAFEYGPALPSPAVFQHAFSGLVTLADWIGSNRMSFPYSKPGDGDRMIFARKRAREVLVHIGLDPRPAREGLKRLGVRFERIFDGRTPRAAQRALLELPLPPAGQGSTVILEAETGAGKTEAALSYAFRLFEAGLVDGLTFVLPTRTAATQLHARVERAVLSAFPPDVRPRVILAVPGYLDESPDDPAPLPEESVLWNDDPSIAERFRSWASESPKRYFAGSIVVGTIDQVLLSALQVNHAQLRATALLRHLLIIDEVHASDVYMTALTCAALDFHRRAGSHALLMSATLGSAAAAWLFAPASARTYKAPRPPQLAEACKFEYPAIAQQIGDEAIRRWDVAAEPQRTKRIEVSTRPWLADDGTAELVSYSVDAARRGAKVLVLRNTVRSANATMDHLERIEPDLVFKCEERPALHHSRFAREDRIALDKAIEATLSGERKGRGCVVIATQTVQQALDLDADLMLTDLAPMDVLLQRFGRLHRHSRCDRPFGFEVPRAVVMVPRDPIAELLGPNQAEARVVNGIGLIYPDLRVIEATRRLLTGTLEIPNMNRELVEKTTHPSALEEIEKELGPEMKAHGAAISDAAFFDRRIADAARLDREVRFGDSKFAELVQAQTRLGDRDRRIEFPPREGAFKTTIRSLNVPWFLAQGWSKEAPTPKVEPRPGGFDLVIGEQRLTYDNRGLRPADGSPMEGDDDVGA